MIGTAFWLCLGIYAIGWAALIAAPMRHRFCWVFARSCAVALAIIYCFLLLTQIDQISSWQALLFSDSDVSVGFLSAIPSSALHILAFNLFIGSWQVEDGPRHQLPYKVILPCLVATAFAGPLGFVGHIVARDIWKSQRSRNYPKEVVE